MKERTVSSRRFGEALAAVLGKGPGRTTLAAQRTALFSQLDRLSDRRAFFRSPLLWSVAGLAAAVAIALFVGLGPTQKPPSELQVRFAGAPVSKPKELRAHAHGAQALEFSDGSEVVLSAATRAVVSEITPERAELRLNQGRLLATIKKATGVTWTIRVGPYQVRVVGTQFSVDWNEARHRLAIEVREGRVRVFGGDLPEPGVLLDAGAHFQRYALPKDTGRSSLEAAKPVDESPRPAARVLASPPRSANSGSNADPEPQPSLGFLELAGKGRYQDALIAAEKQGFEALASSLAENDLVTLANVARFSGNSDRARLALLKLRERFAGRPAAELAALYLARVAEDIEKRPREAVRWLRVFVQESPSGDLAEGARTNLMSILLRTGDADGARSVAEDYLRYHPRGPHAEQARSLMARTRLIE